MYYWEPNHLVCRYTDLLTNRIADLPILLILLKDRPADFADTPTWPTI
jgi:hypothetical protein